MFLLAPAELHLVPVGAIVAERLGSPFTVPCPLPVLSMTSSVGESAARCEFLCDSGVWPEMRLRRPGVDGPNVVSYELSLIA